MNTRSIETDKNIRNAVSDLECALDKAFEPEALAERFCELGSDGQAKFLDEICRMSAEWPNGGNAQWTFLKVNNSTKEMLANMAELAGEKE